MHLLSRLFTVIFFSKNGIILKISCLHATLHKLLNIPLTSLGEHGVYLQYKHSLLVSLSREVAKIGVLNGMLSAVELNSLKEHGDLL